ncbi:MAG: MgtC/SapB family protein [Lentisphaeria bacterium]|nr:MgtC/SapB family protein [Lentisphaeria bacterium]
MEWDLTVELIIRLILAGVMGSLIGLEREYRAKEAGMRTHFLVALGSALIMIVSQWGFQDGIDGTRAADASRVAAQIVSGIGFIGAGTIMMQKQFVRGLTTAAGLWVAAGIGMAIGGGLYLLGCISTVLTLIGLELFQIFFHNLKTKSSLLVFSTSNRDNLITITNALNDSGYRIINCSVSTDKGHADSEHLRVKMVLREHPNGEENHLWNFMQQFPDVLIEKIE